MPYAVKDKVGFLAEASKILSSSLDYNITLASIAKLVVRNIADFCIIDIVENKKIKRVTVMVSNKKEQKIAELMFNYLPDPRNKKAIYEAVHQKKPIIIKQKTEKWLKSVSRIPAEREIVNLLDLQSFIFTPLKSRRRIIGALTLGLKRTSKRYDEADALLVEELAGRAGLAVDNAKLFTEAKNAIQARDEFMSIASHELKTPLTSILLNLQLTLRKMKNTTSGRIKASDIRKMIELSEQQSQRLSRLITELLNTSVVSTGRLVLEKEQVDLFQLTRNVIERFDLQLKKANTKVVFTGEKVTGNWDLIRLEQVISNLLSNAIKYGNEKPIQIEVYGNKNTAMFKIKDQGIGIDPYSKNRIFERFQRTESAKNFKGLGLGLYIGKQIVEAHGGKIKVESIENEGSTFTVLLPV